MTPFSQSITCPFCFSSFSAQEVLFRCVALGCSGRTADPIYANARGFGLVPMGRVLSPVKRFMGIPRMVECDMCKRETRTRVCLHCHFELPHDIGQIDQRIIAIIGGSNTGKSHYIAALITRLQHEVGANFSFGVSMLGDGTRDRWLSDFYRPLFENKTVLQPTLRGAVDSRVKNPLIFRLTLGQNNARRALNLSFFDTAGEDMTALELDTLSIEARYICQADGIIVLLDPLQIESVRQQLATSVNAPHPDPKARPEFLVARLRELMERRLNLAPTRKVKIPVAFTVSKIDTLRPIVAPDSALLRQSEHFGSLDLEDVQSVSTEVGSYLQTWINPNFTTTINLNFDRYRYFGVSSLGSQPDAHNRLTTVNPRRVEDPFLWILYQLALIKGKKGR